jgi:hypothetical protein
MSPRFWLLGTMSVLEDKFKPAMGEGEKAQKLVSEATEVASSMTWGLKHHCLYIIGKRKLNFYSPTLSVQEDGDQVWLVQV